MEAHARAEGSKIVGVYAANERPGDFAVGAAAQKLGKKAAELCPGAVVLLLDAASFQTQLQGQAEGGDSALPFVACLSEGGRWRLAPQVGVRQLVLPRQSYLPLLSGAHPHPIGILDPS